MAVVYAASDICVWPAVNEAYGMAMLEAQAAGLPVVSCATRGVPDVVQHGTTGLLAPQIDAPSLALCLRDLLSDPARRRSMGTASARFVAHSRSLQQAADTLARLLAPLQANASQSFSSLAVGS
jgi:glycosyltransferase involved in cell wall biosynthesis